ncbi:MAG: hypothetical protein IOC39_25820 [Burkholderia sp.]|jgi:hypothetical protein|uniref:hypothetical protein n=3 Tax=Burkholderia sp. TaxID=36773 RepID=UPI00258FD0E3|nr:hypothetical protein [Burkholderia sp.]MCA3776730.1 hypothetical protein [Burkholderia sp.]MCA3819242.1 hypothetical protein [Burkholderia sp.]MCA3825461.1 hypothetical protein [Burkholderia sp.]MCA3842529.1 hypothetical protein [Burkholderia sp.]MCA3852886.1 hypothetical protein [Burkholderia sp.]
MPRIPLGDPASAVAQPGPAVQADPNAFGAATARAQQGLGEVGTQIAADLFQQKQRLDEDLARTNAAVAYQSHATNVQSAMKTAGEQLASGAIDQPTYQQQVADAQKQSFDSTIGSLPGGHYKNIATTQTAGLDRTVALGMQEALTKNTQQLIATNAATLLDTAGKSIATNPASIEGTVASTKQAYLNAAASAGIPQPRAAQIVQDWTDAQWAAHAQSAAIAARSTDDLPALTKLEKDLTSPDGYYAGKLDAGKRNQVLSTVVSLKAQIENQIESQNRARENDAITAVNQAIEFNDSGSYMSPEYKTDFLARTKGTAMEKQAQELVRLNGPANAFSTASASERAAMIQGMERDQANPKIGTDPLEQKQLATWRTIDSRLTDGYKTAPWETAASVGAIREIPQLDLSNPTTIAKSLSARSAAAGVVEQKAGHPISLLTNDEARQLARMLDALPADQRGQEVSDIGFSIGNADRIGALADQLHDERPVDRLALLAGSSQLTSTGGKRIASLIYQGAEAIRDKRAGVDDKLLQGVTALASAQLREAFASAKAAQDAIDTTKYLYAYGAAKNNLSNAAVDDGQLNASISGATGGVVDLNGRKTLKPYGWDDARFDTSVKGVNASSIVTPLGDGKVHIGQTEVPVADFVTKLPAARLVRISPQGVYAVTAGTGYATNSQKQPILIRLK